MEGLTRWAASIWSRHSIRCQAVARAHISQVGERGLCYFVQDFLTEPTCQAVLFSSTAYVALIVFNGTDIMKIPRKGLPWLSARAAATHPPYSTLLRGRGVKSTCNSINKSHLSNFFADENFREVIHNYMVVRSRCRMYNTSSTKKPLFLLLFWSCEHDMPLFVAHVSLIVGTGVNISSCFSFMLLFPRITTFTHTCILVEKGNKSDFAYWKLSCFFSQKTLQSCTSINWNMANAANEWSSDLAGNIYFKTQHFTQSPSKCSPLITNL